MKKLVINNFRAFRKELSVSCPNDENILIYGENGSGKSSLYDAFRLFYFKEKVFNERIAQNVVGDARSAEESSVIDSFRYDKTNDPIVLTIDGEDFLHYSPTAYTQVFLLAYQDLHPKSDDDDQININKMLKDACFKCEESVGEWFDYAAEEVIVRETNRILKEVFFLDGLTLTQSMTGDGLCTLELADRVDKKKQHLTRYFNEATIHLVRLIVLMESIALTVNAQIHSMLVLDDCFNSLDAPNRTFLMRYLLVRTKGMQKIILTHNLSYYNLMAYVLTTEHKPEVWLKYILCLHDGIYKLVEENSALTVADIIKNRSNGIYANSTQLGNAIRQLFEVLIYRISLLASMGAMPESRHLLDLLCDSSQNIYLSTDGEYRLKTATALVDEIYQNVTNGNYYKLHQRLEEKMNCNKKNVFS